MSTPYRTFFTDVVRGEVLSLSTEGVRSISNLGMRDYFADEFKLDIKNVIGTYDIRKREYKPPRQNRGCTYKINREQRAFHPEAHRGDYEIKYKE